VTALSHTASARRRTGTAIVWVGVVVIVVGIVGGIVLLVSGVTSLTGALSEASRVSIPAGGRVPIESPGHRYVYAVGAGIDSSQGATFATVEDQVVLSITDPNGRPVPFVLSRSSTTFELNSEALRLVGEFDAEEAGFYTITPVVGDGGGRYQQVAITPHRLADDTKAILTGVFGGGIAVLVGIVLIVVGAVRRSRAGRLLAPAGGYGAAPTTGSAALPGWGAPAGGAGALGGWCAAGPPAGPPVGGPPPAVPTPPSTPAPTGWGTTPPMWGTTPSTLPPIVPYPGATSAAPAAPPPVPPASGPVFTPGPPPLPAPPPDAPTFVAPPAPPPPLPPAAPSGPFRASSLTDPTVPPPWADAARSAAPGAPQPPPLPAEGGPHPAGWVPAPEPSPPPAPSTGAPAPTSTQPDPEPDE
jgi:hypothetical protein